MLWHLIYFMYNAYLVLSYRYFSLHNYLQNHSSCAGADCPLLFIATELFFRVAAPFWIITTNV